MRVFYLCDRKACETCNYPTCKHTTDPMHAKNFEMGAGDLREIEAEAEVKEYTIDVNYDTMKDIREMVRDITTAIRYTL